MADQPSHANAQGPGQDANGAEKLCIHLSRALKNRRLDKYLQGRFGQFSRTTIQKLIKEQAVTVNARPAKPSTPLKAGDDIELILPPPPSREIIGEDIPLNIIYEDDQIIIINKQADLIVHPARGNTHGTLANGLVYYAENLSTFGPDFRPGIVHRLDRNTTGVMVVAKTDTAHWRLAKQFEKRRVSKSYLAIVHGAVQLHADCISQPLGVHPRVREKYAVRPETGKEATTLYKVIETFRGFTLVKLTPKAGRTHQIRVHLSYIKHPIVADEMYGGRVVYPWQIEDKPAAAQEPIITRCALHAATLKIQHPTTEREMAFEAPMPKDMQELLDALRKFRSR